MSNLNPHNARRLRVEINNWTVEQDRRRIAAAMRVRAARGRPASGKLCARVAGLPYPEGN